MYDKCIGQKKRTGKAALKEKSGFSNREGLNDSRGFSSLFVLYLLVKGIQLNRYF